MRLDKKYPELDQFFGAIFHQDWRLDYATASDGVRDYLGNSNEAIAQAVIELKNFLNEFQDDKALAKAIDALGCEYDPAQDGLTDRAWLSKEVLPMLISHLAQQPRQIAKSA